MWCVLRSAKVVQPTQIAVSGLPRAQVGLDPLFYFPLFFFKLFYSKIKKADTVCSQRSFCETSTRISVQPKCYATRLLSSTITLRTIQRKSHERTISAVDNWTNIHFGNSQACERRVELCYRPWFSKLGETSSLSDPLGAGVTMKVNYSAMQWRSLGSFGVTRHHLLASQQGTRVALSTSVYVWTIVVLAIASYDGLAQGLVTDGSSATLSQTDSGGSVVHFATI